MFYFYVNRIEIKRVFYIDALFFCHLKSEILYFFYFKEYIIISFKHNQQKSCMINKQLQNMQICAKFGKNIYDSAGSS